MRIPDNTGLVQDPIHLGVVILDKIIGDLKSKLPFLNKKKGADEDQEDEESADTETEVSADDADEKTSVAKPNLKSVKEAEDDATSPDEVEEDNSFVGKIKARLNSMKKKPAEEAEEASEEGEEKSDKKARKKPNLIVIAGAVGLIAFVILSDFGEESNPEVSDAEVQKMLKKKAEKKPKEEKPSEEKPAEEKPTETAETKPDTTTTTAPDTTAETPPDTTTTTAPDTTVTTAPDTTTTTAPDTTVTTAPDTTTTTTTPETATTTTTPETTVTTAPDTTTTAPTPDTTTTTTPDTTMTGPDNATVDSVTGEDTTTNPNNLTDQILKDLEDQAATTEQKTVKTEYVAPPNYENVGRGLVYNCSGLHWACIDGPSYKTCEDNSSSTKYLKKKAECFPFNVYETQSGCEKMQNRMVSSSAKTEFCAE